MEHPLLTAIHRAGFAALGWFAPGPEDKLPDQTRFVMLIGNAGPAMFNRFAQERDPARDTIDQWTVDTVSGLAHSLDAQAVYPFDMNPPWPFLSWARRGGAGHVSPLGLNIHPRYGLWHAYRAALLFSVAFDLPTPQAGPHPCESCAAKPCLRACPVQSFDGRSYDVPACAAHLASPAGQSCLSGGCLARHACPVGQDFAYAPAQAEFHMRAFLAARQEA